MEGPSLMISILAIISTVSTQATAATAHDIVFLGPGYGSPGKSEIYAIKTLSSTDTCQIPNYPITGDIHGMIGFTSSSGVTLCGGYSTVYHSECHTLNNQSWTVTEGMITERQYAASSHLLDNSVFVSGGWSNNGRLSSTEILVDGIWREGPTMPTPLSRHCMVSSADTVYIFGGIDGSAFTNKSMKRSGQGQFTSIANLNIGRSNHGCAVVGNQVYIVGGLDSNRDILSSVEIYNTNKNTHKAGPMLPKAVQGPTAISYKTSIMVFGGYSSDGYESKVYRLIDNRWNEVGEMKHPRAWFPAIIVNKDVICGGGELVVDDIGNVGDIETGHAGGDPEYCHLVDCSLPTSSSFCPIKCAVDPTFCRVIDCSLPQSRTLCPRSCSKSDRCGIENSRGFEVSGGSVTSPNQYPWMVRFRDGCGGSLISNRHILTARHCLVWTRNINPSVNEATNHWRGMKVKVSVHNQDDAYDYQENPIKEVAWPDEPDTHDIAMIILEQPVDLNDKTIGTVCLPSRTNQHYEGEKATAMGWGATDFTSTQSPVLKHLELKVSKSVSPNYLYTEVGYVDGVPLDVCSGDSGGPLVHQDPRSRRWTIIGTVKGFGYDCSTNTTNGEGQWNKVTAHLDWIKRIIGN